MKKRKIKIKAVLLLVLSLIIVLIVSLLAFYFINLKGVSSDKTPIEFEIKEGSTYSTLAPSLKEAGLIRNELVFKIYVRLNKPTRLEAGIYKLNKNMGVEGLLKEFAKGNTYNPDAVTITIPEGKTIEQVAEFTSKKTIHSKQDLLNIWDSKAFIEELKKEYWFITDDVLKAGIRHPLEGYLFPSTYELTNKEVSPEYIARKMLDQMELILEKYKDAILNGKYSIHEILTMASIVEYEAILDSDRPIVAGVFYNRLNIGMKLQSCATLGYAIGEWKLTYSFKDMETDSRYNTYYYAGLPIGPGGMPSLKSIEAAINPETHDYYYFLANVCDPTSKKTYFSKTLEEHEANGKKYLACF